MTHDPRFAADLQLARQAAAGSEPHWHALIERYSPLIRSVARRYLRDDDEIGTVWTAVLAKLHDGQLAQFQGQSTLATWLVFVARSEACDHVRRTRGRRRLPACLAGQSELLIAAYTEVFLQGRGPAEATHRLQARGLLAPDQSLAEVITQIEDLVGDRTLRRIAFDLQADRCGIPANRHLERLDVTLAADRAEFRDWSAEQEFHAVLTRQTLERVRAVVAGLPTDQRQVVELRFGQGWTAKRIARALHLKDPREVYTLSERALRSLRKLIGVGLLALTVIFQGRVS